MAWEFATELSGVIEALSKSPELRSAIVSIIYKAPHHGKSLEGNERKKKFNAVLEKLVLGSITLSDSYSHVLTELPQAESAHSHDIRVFPKNWNIRLIQTQLSRFYNQAVIEELIRRGDTECFVNHSTEEQNAFCIAHLAGKTHDLKYLHQILLDSYDNGNYGPYEKVVKVPNHPHCTHVVSPIAHSKSNSTKRTTK